nr:hypothetical protein [Neobacillus sp. Marseille-Q6967]
MAGRKSKLTPLLINDAVKLLKSGNYVTTVCEFIGIDTSTWYRWMREGKKAKTGIKNHFYHAIKKAEAEAEIRMVTDLQKIANENQTWQALAWMLERKYPERWGRKDKISAGVSHTGKVNESHEYNVSIKQKVEHVENKYGNAIERIVRERIQRNSCIDDPNGN